MIFTICSWLLLYRLIKVKPFLYKTWLHLANTFTQSNLQCIQALHLSVCAFDLDIAHALPFEQQKHHNFTVSALIQNERYILLICVGIKPWPWRTVTNVKQYKSWKNSKLLIKVLLSGVLKENMTENTHRPKLPHKFDCYPLRSCFIINLSLLKVNSHQDKTYSPSRLFLHAWKTSTWHLNRAWNLSVT